MNKKESKFDETIITAVEHIEPPKEIKAHILFISGELKGKTFLLPQKDFIIGRGNDVDLMITDNRISRHHIKLSQTAEGVILEDLGSTNGTFVNGKRAEAKCLLKNGDKVHLSSNTLFKFAYGDEVERTFQNEMHQMANYDAVTGIFNKHYFTERVADEFSFSKRTGLPLSLLMIDLDHFKLVNDQHGHMAGDHVLQGVAQTLNKTLRTEDILARYGGEEFVIILRNSNKENCQKLAERLRAAVEEKEFVFEKTAIKITISVGGATLEEDNFKTAEKMIEAADKNLYRSKNEGRNRVTV